MSESDSDDMMRSMMGFSSFGTQRPIKPEKNTSGATSSTGANAVAIAARPAAKKPKTEASAEAGVAAPPTSITRIMQQSGISPNPSHPAFLSATNVINATFSTCIGSTSLHYKADDETSYSADETLASNQADLTSCRYMPSTEILTSIDASSTANEDHTGSVRGTTLPAKPQTPAHLPSFSASPASSNRTSSIPIAYKSPTNPNYTLTSAALTALSSGRRNATGDTVHFKPGFVDPDPWKGLKEMR